jgi:hypothetical protein
MAAPAVTRTPNMHRANESLLESADGSMATAATRREEKETCSTKPDQNRLDSDRPSHGRRLHSKPKSADPQSELEVKSRFAIPRFLIAICSPHRALRVGLLRRRSEKTRQNLCGSAEESVLSGPIRWKKYANTGMFRVFRGKVLPCSVQARLRGGEGGIRTPDTLSGMPVFKTGAINRSATSPARTPIVEEQSVTGASSSLQQVKQDQRGGRRPKVFEWNSITSAKCARKYCRL